jgi:hypothetical protein
MADLNGLYKQRPRLKKVAFWILAYALLVVGLGGYVLAFLYAPDLVNPEFTKAVGAFIRYSLVYYYVVLRIVLSLSFGFLVAGSSFILSGKPWAKTVVRFGIWPCIMLSVAGVVLTFIYGVLGLQFVSSVINYIIEFIIFIFAIVILRTLSSYR